MIDHRRKLIFIHIPKTAGVSMYQMMRYAGPQNHKTRLDYEEDYFSFGVVRNPWDRLVSAYTYVKSGGRGSRGDLFAQDVLSSVSDFDEFVFCLDDIQLRLQQFENPNNGAFIQGYPHFLPQTCWTHAGSTQVLDYLVRFERIEADIDKIRPLLGRRIRRLRVLNRSDREDFRRYYSSEAADEVARRYQNDVEYFGYSF